jgi:hypothetical protein
VSSAQNLYADIIPIFSSDCQDFAHMSPQEFSARTDRGPSNRSGPQ